MINCFFTNLLKASFRTCRPYGHCTSTRSFTTVLLKGSPQRILAVKGLEHAGRFTYATSNMKKGIQQQISALQTKKRLGRKKTTLKEDLSVDPGLWAVCAFSTAEEYDLQAAKSAIENQGLYQINSLPEDLEDVLHLSAKYQVGEEARELYLFSEGTSIFWNIPELERKSVLKFLKPFEINSYDKDLVHEENELMDYTYTESKTKLVNGKIYLNSEAGTLEKYTFSNVIALSVKLAIWEASLERYVESIEDITEDMKKGNKLKMTREQVFRKTGELFSLRHLINLSSDLLDTPDFYWDRQSLESLYQKTSSYLNIAKRTRVMNEKLTYCCELMDLLSHHLEDNHHVRLEVMIIVLIMVEVLFECGHYAEKFM